MSKAGQRLLLSEHSVYLALVRQGVPERQARDMARGRVAPIKSGRGPTRKARNGQPEHDEQVALFQWAEAESFRHPELHWLFAVPNFAGRLGNATARHGAFLRAEGRKKGVPDVFFPVPRGVYHGLVIEMKIKPNRPNDDQRQWLTALEGYGWRVHVCYSAEEAEGALLDYLALPALSSPLPPAA